MSIGFPQQLGGVTLIGYDWLGRILGIRELGQQIYLFEPGTGESLQITQGLKALFIQEVAHQQEALLAVNLNKEWLRCKGKIPRYGYCVGYKTPLFLGGVDDISNLELIDLDVYWHLSVQLIHKAKSKSLGDTI